MAPDAPSDQRDPASTPGAGAVAPAGTHAVALYSDLRCPWAHVAVSRLLAAIDRHGAEIHVDHRWFPLGDDAMPVDAEALDRTLGPFRDLEPDAGWHEWAGSGTIFPRSADLAATWVQAAKRESPAASAALDRALRIALFRDGRDIADGSVVAEVAGTVPDLRVDPVRREVTSGRPAAELARHAELAESDLVAASPTIVLADGTTWTNPGIDTHTEDGVPVVDGDDPGVYDEIVEAFLAQRHYD